ncbi:MAG: hypothetical protein ABIN55_04825 [Aeromicrobium sp.]
METDTIAVVTAPKVISWADVQIDVLAEVPAQKPVFIGLGNSVDVENYVSDTERLEVTDFHTPWDVKTRQVEGRPGLPGAPTALDWWLAEGAGRGGASFSTNLPDETVSLAILSVGDTNLTGLKVSLAYGVKGGFAKGFGLLLFGIGCILLSRLIRRGDDIWAQDDVGDDEEVAYVYVDEQGVEHEISADEVADYEVVDVDETGEPPSAAVVAGGSAVVSGIGSTASAIGSTFGSATAAVKARLKQRPKRARKPVAPEGDEDVVYILVGEDGVEHEISAAEAERYEFVDEVVVPVAEPDVGPAAKPTPPAQDPVKYVFVDEDGVEHEVSEDELADFEFVEEDEDKS